MFCPKCGKELPEGSQFCLSCGNALAASAATVQQQQPAKSARVVPRVIILGLAFGVLFAFLFFAWYFSSAKSGSEDPVASMLHVPYTRVIAQSAITVRANSYSYYKFVAPPGWKSVTVDGHFSATGGAGNDIEVSILGEDAFANFQNHHSISAYYNSGKLTQSNINATLPGPGRIIWS